MGRLSDCHRKLNKDGIGKCSVPMWRGGMPAGFCDNDAYGYQLKNSRYDGYVPALACPGHGGPKKPCPGIDLGDGDVSGCDAKGGDCPACGN